MKGIYNIAVRLYFVFLRFFALFHPKAKKWVEGRRDWKEQMHLQKIHKPVIWFHAASLGEFEQGKPVIDAFKSNHPDWFILVTFFSPSGFEIRRDYENADFTMYLPMETKQNVRDFLDFFQPKIAVFVKYDFWFEYISQLHLRSIPLVFFSVVFRPKHIFFKWYGHWFRNQLNTISQIFVQDEESLQLISGYGMRNVCLAGDTRFDRVADTVNKSEGIPFMDEFKGNNKILFFGSAWKMETKLAVKIIDALPDNWKVIYAPHEIDSQKIHQFQSEISQASVLFTQLPDLSNSKTKVLILNTVGHLARLYKYGDLAVIGGGFDDGIHNILEPLAFGLPVIFGPNHDKFFEAQIVIQNKVGYEVGSVNEAQEVIKHVFSGQINLEEKRRKCHEFIDENQGATQKVSTYLDSLV